ncbi:MAG: cardiolipin synthase [Planctomycetota bacterium]
MPDFVPLLSALVLAAHGLGLASAAHVLMSGRTPQGVVAWIGFLLTIPYVAVPLYWVFGLRRYDGYVDARHARPSPFDGVVEELRMNTAAFVEEVPARTDLVVALERLVQLPLVGSSHVRTLVDGDAAFGCVEAAIDAATSYVLLQFFIVRDDGLGRRVSDALVRARERGVAVHFLYDEVGSRTLTDAFRERLRSSGARIEAFATTRRSHRFQLNFRNHRKLVVVDGVRAFTGGHNLGDEYLGLHPELSPWRDTFFELEGPVVQPLQLAFLEDWYWATDEIPDWRWEPRPAEGGPPVRALVLPTGPADEFESGTLLFVSLFHSAQRRLWISTPYFVFDGQILSALQLAALRGVDVRILVPEHADYETAYYAGWSFHREVLDAGCRIFRYDAGFMHQKAVLVDDDLALIGTMNLDNRSMRLNFELSVLVEGSSFAEELGGVLEADFEASNEVTLADMEETTTWFRLKARAARLFAPIL